MNRENDMRWKEPPVTLEDGVLRLSLQRPEEDKPRRIAITG